MCQSKRTTFSLVAHAQVVLSNKANFACKLCLNFVETWVLGLQLVPSLSIITWCQRNNFNGPCHCCDTSCRTDVPGARDACNAAWKHTAASERGRKRPTKGAKLWEINCFCPQLWQSNVKIVLKMHWSCPRVFVLGIWAPTFYHIGKKIDNWLGHVISISYPDS